MLSVRLVPLMALVGCGGTLSSYDRNPVGHGTDSAALDTATPTATGATTGATTGSTTGATTGSTTGTATGSTTTGATTGGTTGSSTGTTTGSTSTYGTATGSGPPSSYTTTNPLTQTTAFTQPPGPLVDGVYEGWLYVEYMRDLGGALFPPGAHFSTCTGTVTIVVDTSTTTATTGTVTATGGPTITGTLDNCEWPIWDFWAQINLNSMDGNLQGDPTSYGSATGDVTGEDGFLLDFDDSWTGYVLQGPTIAGEWHYKQLLEDEVDGWFVADWVGPVP